MKDWNKRGQSQINVVYFINHIIEKKYKINVLSSTHESTNVYTTILNDILKNKKKLKAQQFHFLHVTNFANFELICNLFLFVQVKHLLNNNLNNIQYRT